MPRVESEQKWQEEDRKEQTRSSKSETKVSKMQREFMTHKFDEQDQSPEQRLAAMSKEVNLIVAARDEATKEEEAAEEAAHPHEEPRNSAEPSKGSEPIQSQGQSRDAQQNHITANRVTSGASTDSKISSLHDEMDESEPRGASKLGGHGQQDADDEDEDDDHQESESQRRQASSSSKRSEESKPARQESKPAAREEKTLVAKKDTFAVKEVKTDSNNGNKSAAATTTTTKNTASKSDKSIDRKEDREENTFVENMSPASSMHNGILGTIGATLGFGATDHSSKSTKMDTSARPDHDPTAWKHAQLRLEQASMDKNMNKRQQYLQEIGEGDSHANIKDVKAQKDNKQRESEKDTKKQEKGEDLKKVRKQQELEEEQDTRATIRAATVKKDASADKTKNQDKDTLLVQTKKDYKSDDSADLKAPREENTFVENMSPASSMHNGILGTISATLGFGATDHSSKSTKMDTSASPDHDPTAWKHAQLRLEQASMDKNMNKRQQYLREIGEDEAHSHNQDLRIQRENQQRELNNASKSSTDDNKDSNKRTSTTSKPVTRVTWTRKENEAPPAQPGILAGISDKIHDAKDSVVDAWHSAGEKIDHLRDDAAHKAEELKRNAVDKTNEIKSNISDKTAEIKRDVNNKTAEIKRDVNNKTAEIKRDVNNKTAEIKTSADRKSTEIKSKAQDVKDDAREKGWKVEQHARNMANDAKDDWEAAKTRTSRHIDAARRDAAEDFDTMTTKAGRTASKARDDVVEDLHVLKSKAVSAVESVEAKASAAVHSVVDETKSLVGSAKTWISGDKQDLARDVRDYDQSSSPRLVPTSTLRADAKRREALTNEPQQPAFLYRLTHMFDSEGKRIEREDTTSSSPRGSSPMGSSDSFRTERVGKLDTSNIWELRDDDQGRRTPGSPSSPRSTTDRSLRTPRTPRSPSSPNSPNGDMHDDNFEELMAETME